MIYGNTSIRLQGVFYHDLEFFSFAVSVLFRGESFLKLSQVFAFAVSALFCGGRIQTVREYLEEG